jgi:hypothetical protein
VIRSMNCLSDAVCSIDVVVYQHTWGRRRLSGLKP